jgi:SAM-dependent methyltransferase
VALALFGRGFNVYGLDIAPTMAGIAQSRIGSKVLVANAGQLPLRPASLCQAYSVWVLHLMGGLPAMLAGVRDALRPGARYLVVPTGRLEPGSNAIAEVIERLDAKLVRAKATTVGMEGRTAESIINAAERAGFRLETWQIGERQRYQRSPNEEADLIAARGYASLLSISAENWRGLVEPAIAELRGLPNPDEPLTCFSARQDMVVLCR